MRKAYCRKIQNGRQIMFQCDRGYSMIEGPSGATCIAGSCYIHTKITQMMIVMMTLFNSEKIYIRIGVVYKSDVSAQKC